MKKENKPKVQKNTKPSEKAKKERKKRNFGKDIITFPVRLLEPVGKFLFSRIKKLEKSKKKIEKEDPFKDTTRVVDNATPDTDAAEQFGHARTTALKDHIDKTIIQTKKALARVKLGKYGLCEDCHQMIDTDRLMIQPAATLCTKCKIDREK